MVHVGQRFACVKVLGRANFTLSVDFQTLVSELRRRGFALFVIDLAECALMDSTFLGALAGLGLRCCQSAGEAETGSVQLLNPNERVTELLENLGALHLFRVARGPLALPEAMEACAHEPARPSREQVVRACLEAHETLMAINPQNVARFKDVTKFLAEDLQKLKAGG